MNRIKAIKILEDIIDSEFFTPNWDVSEAIKLGIEALKGEKDNER